MAKMRRKAREAREGGDRQEVRLIDQKQNKKLSQVVCWCCFSEFTSFWGFIWRCNDMICIYLEALEKCQSTFPVSPAVTLRGWDSGEQGSGWAVLDHHGGTVVSEDGTLLSRFSPDELLRWCSVRGCLEDNVTIWSLLASPKRYGEFQIPSFTYILSSTPKFQSPIMSYGWLWLKIRFQFIDEVQGSWPIGLKLKRCSQGQRRKSGPRRWAFKL